MQYSENLSNLKTGVTVNDSTKVTQKTKRTNENVKNSYITKEYVFNVSSLPNKFNDPANFLEFRELCYTKKSFTEIHTYKSGTDPKAIKKYYSLSSLIKKNNSLVKGLAKDLQPAFLKGVFSGGSNGSHLTKNSPFLFFDIDIKKDKENSHLYENRELLNRLFEVLKEVAVFVGRSHSGLGIYGLLYVPALNLNYSENNTELHRLIGKEINNYLCNTSLSDFNVTFDFAQNKLRQIRYLTAQSTPIVLNKNFIEFKVETQINETIHKIKNFDRTETNNKIVENIVNRTIETAINIVSSSTTDKHYSHLKAARLLGGLVGGGYITESEALQHINFNLGKDVKAAHETQRKGIAHGKNSPLHYDFILTEHNVKQKEIKEAKHHISTLVYDKTINVNKWFGEAKNELIKEIESKKRVLISAQTGTGKTHFFSKDFASEKRKTLLCVPLIAIAKQVSKEYNIEMLDAENQEFEVAVHENIIVATYEQALKVINSFDYIVIDEAHNLLNYQGFKSKTIKSLIQLTKEFKKNTILVTATPHPLFKRAGYNMVNVKLKKFDYENVNIHYHKNKPIETLYSILDHYKKNDNLTFVKYNNIDHLKQVKSQFIENNIYKENEIFVIYSGAEIEQSKEYNTLLQTGLFPAETKIILATSKINDGLNIYDKRVKNVIYIENQRFVNPLDFRQFIARIRNKENVNYSLYLTEKKSEVNTKYSSVKEYTKVFNYMQNDLKDRNFLLNNNINRPIISGTLKSVFSKNDNLILINNKFEVFKEKLIYNTANKEFSNYDTSSLQSFLKMNFGINSELKNSPLEVTENAEIEIKNFDNYIYKAFKFDFEKLLMLYLYFAAKTGTAENIRKLLNIDFSNKIMFQDIEYKDILEMNIKRIGTLLKRFFELKSLNIDPELIESYLFDFKENEYNLKANYSYRKIFNIYSLHKLNSLDTRTAEKLSIDGFFQHRELKSMLRKLSSLKAFNSRKNWYSIVNKQVNYSNTFFRNETNVIFFLNMFFKLETNANKEFRVIGKKDLKTALKLIE